MGLLYGSMSAAGIVAMGMAAHVARYRGTRFDAALLLDTVKYGAQLVPKSATGFVNRYFDKYLLNNVLSTSSVGVYQIGQSVGGTVSTLMASVWMSFQPTYNRAVFERGGGAASDVGKTFTSFAYLGILPVMLLVLCADAIVRLIAPPAYHEARDVLVIIAAGLATQTFGMAVGVQYAYANRPAWIFPITLAGTTLNVLGNLALAPRFGLVGAAWAATMSLVVMNTLFVVIGQKFYRVQYETRTLVLLYAVLAGAVTVSLASKNLGVGAAFTYAAKTALLGAYVWIGFRAGLIQRHRIGDLAEAFGKMTRRKAYGV
jgi:O-antigen/teichoic acid export membrane protein